MNVGILFITLSIWFRTGFPTMAKLFVVTARSPGEFLMSATAVHNFIMCSEYRMYTLCTCIGEPINAGK